MEQRFPVSRLLISGLALVPFLVACRRDTVFTTMSDSTFVHAMIELRRLPVGRVDPLSRTPQRDAILRKYNITGPDLESTAVRLAGDPQRASEIWRVIESNMFVPP